MDDRLRKRSAPFPLYEILLRDAKVGDLKALSDRLGLSLNVEEMDRIQEYFRRIGREPTDVELQSLGQAWSEHCCYKSSKVFLKEFIFPVQAPYVLDRGDAGLSTLEVVIDQNDIGQSRLLRELASGPCKAGRGQHRAGPALEQRAHRRQNRGVIVDAEHELA